MSDVVRSLVVEAAEEFFKSVGVVKIVNLGEGSSGSVDKNLAVLSSMLRFSGEKIKAALIVEGNHPAVAATNPQREYKKDLNIDDHTDWIGEIANQIVGNLKRILHSYGVECNMGTPVVMSGQGAQVVSSDQVYRHLKFSVDGHILRISFNAQVSADVKFETRNEEIKDQLSGGDTFLF